MQWTKPEFEQITLNMEVTAYVNTDESQPWQDDKPERLETVVPLSAAGADSTLAETAV